MTNQIRQLPPSVINKIAAGEVIERPASVVKELLENSVDAGATRIDVAVEKGGTELIRVADNGCGISADQVHLAVASHATSKIRDADDLFQVASMGFRGEALASIAEVSRLVLRSRTLEAEAGVQLDIDGGRAGEVSPCGCPVGTTLEVRNLFFNTPVRRKFMRTTQTEMGHIGEAFTRIALANADIHFTLKHNDKLQHELPATDNWRQRIATFFGDELDASLIPVEGNDEDVHLYGYAADPNQSRGNNRMQYIFLNGRHIRDRSLQHALGEAYRGLLLHGRFPIAFLRIDVPPDSVDVNVHPAKLEVRFQDGGRIYSQLLGTLRKKFLSTDLTAKVGSRTDLTPHEPEAAVDAQHADEHRQKLEAWAKGAVTGDAEKSDTTASPQHALDFSFEPIAKSNISILDSTQSANSHQHSVRPETTVSESPAGKRQFESPPASKSGPHRTSAVQIHNRYLVTENEEGVIIIDQHALHERILYEQLRERVLDGKLEAQRLLVPEPVSLTSAEAAIALDSKELLAQLGIEIEPFGGDTILVSAYPAMLSNLSPAEMLRQVVEQLMSGGKQPERRDLLDELLHMVSCKAAIKAGDRLSHDEITHLIEHRSLCQDAHHCPHGRPTALVFTREELDRRFKRT